MCVTGDPTLVEPNDVPSDDDGVVSPLGIVMTPVLSLTTSCGLASTEMKTLAVAQLL